MDGVSAGAALSVVGVVGTLWVVWREVGGRSLFGPPATTRLPDTKTAVAVAVVLWSLSQLAPLLFGWRGVPAVLAAVIGNAAVAVVVLPFVARGRWRGRLSRPRQVGLALLVAVLLLGLSQAQQLGLSAVYEAAGLELPTQALVVMFRDGSVAERAVLALAAAVLAPFAEEVFFRGALLPALATRMPIRAALLVQAAAFGAMHFVARGLVFLPLAVPLAVVGWVLGRLYLRTGSLRLAVLTHACFNGIQVGIMFLAT